MTITSDDINDIIVDAFKWWDHIPPLTDIQYFSQLVREHTGHFYDADTRRFFGTHNPHMPAPGITVECQRNAPDGVPKYAITAWVLDDGKLTPNTVHRADTLRQADRIAIQLSKAWPR